MLGRDRGGDGSGRNPFGPVTRAVADPSEAMAGSRKAAEPGPGPVRRAAVGVLLGAACGALTLVVLPRRAETGASPGPR